MVSLDARSKNGMKSITDIIMEACKEKMERDRKRGIKNRPVRAMVVGIPNVGKSTFINSYAGKACAKTGNKPGVTKGKQWIRLSKSVELLDTPGILWPKFEDQKVGLRLALIGSIRDEILNTDELAVELIRFLKTQYPGILTERYEVEETQKETELLCGIAENRKCITKGGELDYSKAAGLLIENFGARAKNSGYPSSSLIASIFSAIFLLLWPLQRNFSEFSAPEFVNQKCCRFAVIKFPAFRDTFPVFCNPA